MSNEFFDQALDAGKRLVNQGCAKAADLADRAKIRFRISETETELNRKYRKLGIQACDAMDLGDLSLNEEMQHTYNEIEALKRTLESLKETL